MGRVNVIVKCQGLVHHGLKTGACGAKYKTQKEAYAKRLNKCPVCGSTKAAWQGPEPRREPE